MHLLVLVLTYLEFRWEEIVHSESINPLGSLADPANIALLANLKHILKP